MAEAYIYDYKFFLIPIHKSPLFWYCPLSSPTQSHTIDSRITVCYNNRTMLNNFQVFLCLFACKCAWIYAFRTKIYSVVNAPLRQMMTSINSIVMMIILDEICSLVYIAFYVLKHTAYIWVQIEYFLRFWYQ